MFSFWCPDVFFSCPPVLLHPSALFLWPKQHDVTSMSRYHLRSVPRVNCRPQPALTSLPPRNEHRRLRKPKVRLRQLSPSAPPQLCSNIAPRAFKMNPNALRLWLSLFFCADPCAKNATYSLVIVATIEAFHL